MNPPNNKSVVSFEDPLALVGDKHRLVFEDFLDERRRQQAPSLELPTRGGGSSGVCRFYAKGFCINGSSCPHKHLRNDKAVVCKHWLRGLCKKGDVCEFLHEYDMAKMPECYFFSQYGECANEDCLYLHITNQERESVCVFYQRGFCKHGGACRNRHDARVLCPNYALGFCPNGPNCDFGHPEFDSLAEGGLECRKCGRFGHKAVDCPERKK